MPPRHCTAGPSPAASLPVAVSRPLDGPRVGTPPSANLVVRNKRFHGVDASSALLRKAPMIGGARARPDRQRGASCEASASGRRCVARWPARRAIATLATLILVLPARPALAQSGAVLTLQRSTVSASWGSASAPPQLLTDPRRAEGLGTDLYVLSDLDTGTLRARAAVPPGGDDARSATATFEATFLNSGSGMFSVGAGAVQAMLDARFTQALGPDVRGTLSNVYSASLSGFAPGINGSADVLYRYENARRLGWPVEDFSIGGSPGFLATGSADPSGLSVTLGLPGFTLLPGQVLQFRLSVSAYASVVNPGNAPLWAADTDAANSALLSLRLPADVSVLSALPLAWVSVVPEPAALLLWLIGLLAMACVRSGRARHPRS